MSSSKRPSKPFAERDLVYTPPNIPDERLGFARDLKAEEVNTIKEELDSLEGSNLSPRTKRFNMTFLKLNGSSNGNAYYCAKYYGYTAPFKGKGHGIVLGRGTDTTRVKMIRDIESGKWYAAKIKNIDIDPSVARDQIARCEQELANWKILGKTIGGFTRVDGKPQFIIGFELALGINLEKFAEQQMSLRLSQNNACIDDEDWLEIIDGMTDNVLSVFSAGLLHRDIKLPNFVLDQDAFRITLIDLDVALPHQNNQQAVTSEQLIGPARIIAPEIYANVSQDKVPRYDEKTEVFALGLSIAEALGFNAQIGNPNHPWQEYQVLSENPTIARVIDPKDYQAETRSYPIRNKELGDIIIKQLTRMTDPTPENRPSLAECKQFTAHLRRVFIAKLDATKQKKHSAIAFLDIETYLNATEKERSKLVEALREYREVKLIDADNRHQSQHANIGRRLKQAHVPLYNRYILNSADTKLTAKELFEHVKDEMQVTMPDYRFEMVDPAALKKAVKAKKIDNESVDKELRELLQPSTTKADTSYASIDRARSPVTKSPVYTRRKNQSNPACLTRRNIDTILGELRAERDDLVKKYNIAHPKTLYKNKNPSTIAEKRYIAIQDLISDLYQKKISHTPVSFTGFIEQLEVLEKTMTGSSAFGSTMTSFESAMPTEAKAIQKIKQDVVDMQQLAEARHRTNPATTPNPKVN